MCAVVLRSITNSLASITVFVRHWLTTPPVSRPVQMPQPCSVIGCKPSDQRGRVRHRLPRDKAQRLAWRQCIGVPVTQKHVLVCDRHFKEEDYIHDPRIRHGMSTVLRPVLRPGTLPTLFLPSRPPSQNVPDPCCNTPDTSQTCQTCRCRRAALSCTASTQTTWDDYRHPTTTSENGTQTLAM